MSVRIGISREPVDKFFTSVILVTPVAELTNTEGPSDSRLTAGGVKTLVKSVYMDCIMLLTCRRKDGLRPEAVAREDTLLFALLRISEVVVGDSLLDESKAEDSADRQDIKH